MSDELPIIYIARHGETQWSLTGQHTGLTDMPLVEQGERNARRLGERLRNLSVTKVLTSPLQRAFRTCELAGYGDVAEVDRDLVEWDYGEYEGLRSAEILKRQPEWQLFRDGCPSGETPQQISARADRVVARLRAIHGNALLFSSGHIIRVLAARWLGLELTELCPHLMLGTASLSALSYEHNVSNPSICLWNESLRPET